MHFAEILLPLLLLPALPANRRKHWFRAPTNYDAAEGVLSWTHTPTKGAGGLGLVGVAGGSSTADAATQSLPSHPAAHTSIFCFLYLLLSSSPCSTFPCFQCTMRTGLPTRTSSTRAWWRRCSAARTSAWRCW